MRIFCRPAQHLAGARRTSVGRVALLVAVVVVMTACGSSNGGDQAGGTTTSAAPSTTDTTTSASGDDATSDATAVDAVGDVAVGDLSSATVPFANCDGTDAATLTAGYFECAQADLGGELRTVGIVGLRPGSAPGAEAQALVADLTGDGAADGLIWTLTTGGANGLFDGLHLFQQQGESGAGELLRLDSITHEMLSEDDCGGLPDLVTAVRIEGTEIVVDGLNALAGDDFRNPTGTTSGRFAWDGEELATVGRPASNNIRAGCPAQLD